ncbi:MAG: J domain-containing protein [Terriglobia bacterium]
MAACFREFRLILHRGLDDKGGIILGEDENHLRFPWVSHESAAPSFWCRQREISTIHPMNFYEVLNLHPKASVKEIEEAYFLQARQVHPGAQPNLIEDSEERMNMLNLIRDILLNPERRSQYDAKLQKAEQSASRQSWQGLGWSPPGFHKSWVVLLLAGVILGTALGGSLWFHRQISSPIPPPAFKPAVVSIPPSTFGPAPEASSAVVTDLPIPRANSAKVPAQVIQRGSSLSEIVAMMGDPDQVEENGSQGIKILHYGKLRLILHQDKLVQGLTQP